MLDRLILLAVILDYAIDAKTNHYVRTDTSAPELEIDQREYTNPDVIKKIPEKKSDGETKNIEKYGIINDNALHDSMTPEEFEEDRMRTREKKELPSQTTSEHDSMPFHMKILDIDEDLNDVESKDSDIISVSSYNLPKMPTKVYGPKKKPFRRPPFTGVGPGGIDEADKPTCNEFSRTARFNPFSVLNERWFNFYRWAPDNTPLVIEFSAPTSYEIDFMRSRLDAVVEQPISWSSRKVVMIDVIYNITALLVERGDRGQFWMYALMKNYSRMIQPLDVRFKQTADNRYFGLVLCEDDRAFIFSRVNDVPRKNEIPDVVAQIGWRGRDGRSYLYQGHKWAPIPEMTEEEYWKPSNLRKEEVLPPPPEEDFDEEPIKFLNKDYKYKPKRM